MSLGKTRIGISQAYSRLSAAIVASGIKGNDEKFLHSNWCADLLMLANRQSESDSSTYRFSLNKLLKQRKDI